MVYLYKNKMHTNKQFNILYVVIIYRFLKSMLCEHNNQVYISAKILNNFITIKNGRNMKKI